MKRFLWTAVLVLTALGQGMAQETKTVEVCVANEWNADRQDELVVLRLSEVKRLKFDATSAVVTLEGKEIPCQLDDLNGDQQNDELVWLCDIGAGQRQTYHVTLMAEGEPRTYTPRVYADMMLDDKRGRHPLVTRLDAPGGSNVFSDLYHHGPAFESELTAYRIYFDHRQNIDIYGKRLRRLELADTHFYTTAEQLAQGYGNDVLWAGQSIGCGSLKLWNGQSPRNWEKVAMRSERIVASGPLRTVVEVEDRGVELPTADNSGDENEGGPTVAAVRTRYTLYAGHRELRVDVSVIPVANALPDRPFLCTGVQKVGASPQTLLRDDGIAASWGGDYPEQSSQQMKELFPPESIGLAVYVPHPHTDGKAEDALNCLFVLKPAPKEHALHYYVSFCADKEQDGYHSADEWFASLDGWKERLDRPLRVEARAIRKRGADKGQ